MSHSKNGPCKDKRAVCVVGDFWTCPSCDNPKPATGVVDEWRITLAGNAAVTLPSSLGKIIIIRNNTITTETK